MDLRSVQLRISILDLTTLDSGNIRELENTPVGYNEFRWASEYGAAYKLKGGYGVRFYQSIRSPRHRQMSRKTYSSRQIPKLSNSSFRHQVTTSSNHPSRSNVLAISLGKVVSSPPREIYTNVIGKPCFRHLVSQRRKRWFTFFNQRPIR